MGKGGEPRNSHFKPKTAKNRPNMAFKRRHVTSNDSVLIFLKSPHRELQFEYHIEYFMKTWKFDPTDLLKILVKLLKTAKNDQNKTFFRFFFPAAFF